jgi:hypothetical protein
LGWRRGELPSVCSCCDDVGAGCGEGNVSFGKRSRGVVLGGVEWDHSFAARGAGGKRGGMVEKAKVRR